MTRSPAEVMVELAELVAKCAEDASKDLRGGYASEADFTAANGLDTFAQLLRARATHEAE